MKAFLLLLPAFLLAGLFRADAQTRTRIETVQRGYVTTFRVADKRYPGTETVVLTLRDLENCTTPPGTTSHVVYRDGQVIATLRPSNPRFGVGYRYSYRIFRGRIDPKVDTALVCRLPGSTGKTLRVGGMSNVYDKGKRMENRESLGYYYYMDRGDTVFAARRGVVIGIDRGVNAEEQDRDVSFTTERPKIRIEHRDGSFARYSCLDAAHVFVSEGDEVFPDTPLALAGSYDGEKYLVGLQFYWQATNPDPAARDRQPTVWRSFFPPFAMESGTKEPIPGLEERPVADRELLTREMDRREVRRRYGR